MSNEELWTKFLENIKNEVSDVSLVTWFGEDETKLYSLKDDIATIVVNQDLTKKHLESHYLDMMTDVMNRITDSNITINIFLVLFFIS